MKKKKTNHQMHYSDYRLQNQIKYWTYRFSVVLIAFDTFSILSIESLNLNSWYSCCVMAATKHGSIIMAIINSNNNNWNEKIIHQYTFSFTQSANTNSRPLVCSRERTPAYITWHRQKKQMLRIWIRLNKSPSCYIIIFGACVPCFVTVIPIITQHSTAQHKSAPEITCNQK